MIKKLFEVKILSSSSQDFRSDRHHYLPSPQSNLKSFPLKPSDNNFKIASKELTIKEKADFKIGIAPILKPATQLSIRALTKSARTYHYFCTSSTADTG